MQVLEIPAPLAQAIFDYLARRPFIEVEEIIRQLRACDIKETDE